MSSIIFSLLRPLLYPFSILYGCIVWLRNRFYNWGILSSVQFSVPVISVGNLSTGGTGKTPHIEYLIKLLQYEYNIATMSRGYKRHTRGFLLADDKTTAFDIGDEPMQFHRKFPEIAVSVCEDRMIGIPQLLGSRPTVDVVLLDDAFQHRSVKPGLNILITDYRKPFYKDYILPFGSLRESRSAYKRADVIIISKCNDTLSDNDKKLIIGKIKPLNHQQVFFTTIQYEGFIDFFTGASLPSIQSSNIILVSGIARPEPLQQHLIKNKNQVHLLRYPDHHYFTKNNLEEIKSTFDNWDVDDKWIVTTEKDATRLALYKDLLATWTLKIAVLPVSVMFLGDKDIFDNHVRTYIQKEEEENADFFGDINQ